MTTRRPESAALSGRLDFRTPQHLSLFYIKNKRGTAELRRLACFSFRQNQSTIFVQPKRSSAVPHWIDVSVS